MSSFIFVKFFIGSGFSTCFRDHGNQSVKLSVCRVFRTSFISDLTDFSLRDSITRIYFVSLHRWISRSYRVSWLCGLIWRALVLVGCEIWLVCFSLMFFELWRNVCLLFFLSNRASNSGIALVINVCNGIQYTEACN